MWLFFPPITDWDTNRQEMELHRLIFIVYQTFWRLQYIWPYPSLPAYPAPPEMPEMPNTHNEKAPITFVLEASLPWKEAATYSPALHCSTIGASRLNFSVRNGKRWNPAAITTWYIADLLTRQPVSNKTHTVESVCYTWESFRAISSARLWRHRL